MIRLSRRPSRAEPSLRLHTRDTPKKLRLSCHRMAEPLAAGELPLPALQFALAPLRSKSMNTEHQHKTDGCGSETRRIRNSDIIIDDGNGTISDNRFLCRTPIHQHAHDVLTNGEKRIASMSLKLNAGRTACREKITIKKHGDVLRSINTRGNQIQKAERSLLIQAHIQNRSGVYSERSAGARER